MRVLVRGAVLGAIVLGIGGRLAMRRGMLFASLCFAGALIVLTPWTVHRLLLFVPVVGVYLLLFRR